MNRIFSFGCLEGTFRYMLSPSSFLYTEVSKICIAIADDHVI